MTRPATRSTSEATATHFGVPVRALFLLAFLVACAKPPVADHGAPPVPVDLAAVTTEALVRPVVGTGTFGSRDEIPLAFKIGGVVARVLVEEGQPVERGQLLATLDLREIDAQVAKAKVALDKALRDHARMARLAADSVATRAQLDDAASALDAARADYNAASVNREYASIVAPESGVVLSRAVTAGSTISSGTTVLRLGGSARGRVLRAGLSDRDALRVRMGDRASVRFDAIPDRAFSGVVTLKGAAADARTGTYSVEVSLLDSRSLPAGLVGQVEITVQSLTTATFVPVDALLEADRDSATVYTALAGTGGDQLTALRHRVRIVQLVDDRAAVTGLDATTQVITAGAPYLTPGARIRVSRLSDNRAVTLGAQP